jgi:hypothetical protein
MAGRPVLQPAERVLIGALSSAPQQTLASMVTGLPEASPQVGHSRARGARCAVTCPVGAKRACAYFGMDLAGDVGNAQAWAVPAPSAETRGRASASLQLSFPMPAT